MRLDDFIDFNSHCPLCKNPLTLYLQLLGSICFKAQAIGNYRYKLTQDRCKNKAFDNDFAIIDFRDLNKSKFSSRALKKQFEDKQMYLFYMCNDKGFKETTDSWSNKPDYEIRLYYGCYYRATPIFHMNKDNIRSALYSMHDDLINSSESFSINVFKDNEERVYMIHNDHELCESILYYYTCDEEQKQKADYKPSIFEKRFGLLTKLELDNKEKLVSKFDGWILMS